MESPEKPEREEIIAKYREILKDLDQKNRDITTDEPKTEAVMDLLSSIQKAWELVPGLIKINERSLEANLWSEIDTKQYDLFLLIGDLKQEYLETLTKSELEDWKKICQTLIKFFENDLEQQGSYVRGLQEAIGVLDKIILNTDIKSDIQKSWTSPITPEDEKRIK